MKMQIQDQYPEITTSSTYNRDAKWCHWVARTQAPHTPFTNSIIARRTWIGLHHRFPSLIAAVLMPNHLHLLIPARPDEADGAGHPDFLQLKGLLGGISQQCKISCLWEPVPPPEKIKTTTHLQRRALYITENPLVKGLCTHPAEWFWSSYREMTGACPRFPEMRKHRRFFEPEYLKLQPPAKLENWMEYSISDLFQASAATLRCERDDRNLLTLFILMARRYGWQNRTLSEICKISSRALRYQAEKMRNPRFQRLLACADQCLGEPRLRAFAPKLG